MKLIAQLINPGTAAINIKDYNCLGVFNKEELKETKNVSLWIVNLHLNWDNNHLQNNYGLDMGVYIRKELISKAPIFFYSHLKEENFTKLIRATVFKYKLLQTPECYYIEAPIKHVDLEKLIETTSPISDFCLEDINYFVFNAKGRIDELCHNLKNDLKEVSNNAAVIEQFKNYCANEIVSNRIDELNKIIENLKNDLKTNLNKDNTYFDVINKYKPQIVTLLPTSDEDNDENTNENTTENINWQVIYLEDDEQVAVKVENYFKENGVTCHIATSETEAKQKLDDNPNVTLFITDIRLKDKNGKWHKHQGYDVIAQIANHSKMPLVFAVLTSKKGSIINSAKQKLQHQIFWENKDNVLHSKQAFDIYFNRLKELADENFVSNESFKIEIPSWNTVWNLQKFSIPFFKFYNYYKCQEISEYEKYETEINETVLKLIKQNSFDIEWSKTCKSQSLDSKAKHFFKIKLIARRFLFAKIFEISTTIKELETIQKIIFEGVNNVDSNIQNDNYYLKYITNFYRDFPRHLGTTKKFNETLKNIANFYLGINNKSGILKEEYEFLVKNNFIKNHIEKYSIDPYENIKNYMDDSKVSKDFLLDVQVILKIIRNVENRKESKHYLYLNELFDDEKSITKDILELIEKMIIDMKKINADLKGNFSSAQIKSNDIKSILKNYNYLD